MINRNRIITGALIGIVAATGFFTVNAIWQKNRSIAISEASQFRIQLSARPHGKPGLKTIVVDLSTEKKNEPGSLVFRLRRASLGSTDETYLWDGKADVSFAQNDISFVDFNKLVRTDGAVTAWDVNMAEPGRLRLKVWRDLGAFWQVVAQSDVVTPESGLNHFELNPPLPVKRGDYIGLYIEKAKAFKLVSPENFGIPVYLRDQSPWALAVNAQRRLEATFKGNVAFADKAGAVFPGLNPNYAYKVYFTTAPVQETIGYLVEPGLGGGAVHQFTLVDLAKVAPKDGHLAAWEAVAVMPGEVKLIIWRRKGELWSVIGQSKLETVRKGLNKFSLDPPLAVQKGDYLGYFTGTPPQQFPRQEYTAATNTDKLYVNGSFEGEIAEAQMYHDKAGNYSFMAIYAPDDPRGELMAPLNLKPGRYSYRFELPEQDFVSDEQLEFSIESVGNAGAVIHPRLQNLFSSGGGNVGLEYKKNSAVTAALVVAGDPLRWPFSDVILLVLSGLGLIFLLIPLRHRRHLIPIALLPAAAIAVWAQWISAAPIVQLLPAMVVMLILPGYVILELVFPALARSLHLLERPPLLFGLSLGVWTLIGLPAYRLQWASDAVIGGILMAICLGLLAIAILRRDYSAHLPTSEEPTKPFPHAWLYYAILVALLTTLAIVVGYSAQFQGAASDTISHLASYHKIADSARIIGGNAFLGPGMKWEAHYASNPWYLVFGLTARQAHVEVGWLFVYLSAAMTLLVFLSLLFLLKTMVNDLRTSILGMLLAICPFVYGLAVDWRVLNSHYLEYLAYPYTFASLILFPMLIAICLRYVLFRETGWLVLTILLALAATGVHLLFVVWTPFLLCGMLAVSLLFRRTRQQWKSTITLITAIGVIALVVGYATVSFGLARHTFAPMSPAEMQERMSSKGMIQIGPGWFIADPSGLANSAWKMVLWLAIIGLFGSHSVLPTIRKKGSGWLAALKIQERNPDLRVTAMLAGALFLLVGIVIYNPLVVRWVSQIFNAPHPIYRMSDTIRILGRAVQYGALACVLGLALNNRSEWRWRLLGWLPAVAVSLTIVLPLEYASVRSAMVNPLANTGWFPSVLDLPNDTLYRALSRLSPGVVTARAASGQLVAAFTPHYLVADPRILGTADLKQRKEGVADSERILTFDGSSNEIGALLAKYHCRYIIVPINERQLPRFYENTNMFEEVVRSETDVLFQVK